jgi:hypothetical protein
VTVTANHTASVGLRIFLKQLGMLYVRPGSKRSEVPVAAGLFGAALSVAPATQLLSRSRNQA